MINMIDKHQKIIISHLLIFFILLLNSVQAEPMEQYVYDNSDFGILSYDGGIVDFVHNQIYDKYNVIVKILIVDNYQDLLQCNDETLQECVTYFFHYLELDRKGLPTLNLLIMYDIENNVISIGHAEDCSIDNDILNDILNEPSVQDNLVEGYNLLLNKSRSSRHVYASAFENLVRGLENPIVERMNSACEIELKEQGCINYINNGNPEEKLDILVIGEDLPEEELKRILDYAVYEHGFNEYLQDYLSDMNIWYLDEIQQDICVSSLIQRVNIPSFPCDPIETMILEKMKCDDIDHTIVYSNDKFRSYNMFGTRNSYVSVSSIEASSDEEYYSEVGHVTIHEFGHFMGLVDEYADNLNPLNFYGANCQPNLEDAREEWGYLEELGAGYYFGCAYSKDNIKPHFRSIMSGGYKWGIVNEYAIKDFFENKGWE